MVGAGEPKRDYRERCVGEPSQADVWNCPEKVDTFVMLPRQLQVGVERAPLRTLQD